MTTRCNRVRSRTVAAERVHSAIDRVWTAEQERSYLELLSPREVIYVAVNERSEIVGLQIVDRWSSLESMAHVGREVPDDFRGPAMPHLARRIAGANGNIDAAVIGAAEASLYHYPDAWEDWGSRAEVLQRVKQLWHVLMHYGAPAIQPS